MNQIKSLEHFLHVVILDKFYLIVMGLFAMCVCGGGRGRFQLAFRVQLPEMFTVLQCM